MYVQVHYLLSFSLIFNVLGTFLIVRETRVVLCSTSPMLTGVPRCPRLQIWSDTTSSVLSAMPCTFVISQTLMKAVLAGLQLRKQNLDWLKLLCPLTYLNETFCTRWPVLTCDLTWLSVIMKYHSQQHYLSNSEYLVLRTEDGLVSQVRFLPLSIWKTEQAYEFTYSSINFYYTILEK